MLDETPLNQLKRAVELLHGQSQLAGAASECGPRKVEPQHVWNWLNREKQTSADYVLQISKATDFRVTPHELRPDLYPNPKDGLPARKPRKNPKH